MPKRRPVIVLIDDEEASRETLADALDATLDVEVRRPRVVIGPGKIDEVALREALVERPDLIIIDIVWTSPSSELATDYYDFAASRMMQKVLAPIPAYKEGPAPTYLLSGYRQREEAYRSELNRWRAEAFRHHLDVRSSLTKPIGSKDVEALLDKRVLSAEEEIGLVIENSMLPMRVLSDDRQALACNDAWAWGLNDPDPGRSTQRNLELLGPATRVDEASKRLGLRSFRIEEIELKGDKRLQIAHPLGAKRAPSKPAFLKQLFDVAREAGFTRMRYYERSKVPYGGGHLRQSVLLHWFPNTPKSLDPEVQRQGKQFSPPYRIPIKELEDPLANADASMAVFDRAAGDAPSRKQLVCHVAPTATTRHGENFFNALTRSEAHLERMRVPVYVPDPATNRELCEGLLVLDRKGNDADPAVTEQRTEWLKVPLLAACSDLREIFRLEAVARERESLREVRRRALECLESDEELFKSIGASFVRHLVELTGAQGAALFWAPHPDLVPTVAAIYPTNDPWVTREQSGLGQPLEDGRHPVAFRAWQTKEDAFEPCLKAGAATKPQSRIALLVKIAGKAYGCVGMMHRTPFFFDEARVELIRQFIELMTFPLQFAGQQDDRRVWETMLVHELRTPVAGAQNYLESLAFALPQVVEDEAYHSVDAYLTNISGTILSLETLMRDPDLTLEPVCADEVLADVLKRASMDMHRRTFQAALSAPDVQILARDKLLDRVLYILVDNAIKYGKRQIDVQVRTRLDDGHWHCEIENRGAMSAEDYRHRFDKTYVKVGQNGMHIGLGTAQKLCSMLNATLDIDNMIDRDLVRARLKWPIERSTSASKVVKKARQFGKAKAPKTAKNKKNATTAKATAKRASTKRKGVRA